MLHSSERIDVIAGALARAQTELVRSTEFRSRLSRPASMHSGHQTFRQASLTANAEIVRTTFARQDIAIVQTTRIHQQTGRLHLTTLLTHVSGEWISSDLPVRINVEPLAELEPALTDARRYAILSLAGFSGELAGGPESPITVGSPPRPRDSKTLQEPPGSLMAPDNVAGGLAFPKEPPRKRSKAHLAFVRGRGCLVCQKTPADAHHLKFAQPSTLGRKVSDEFTVPLCRQHHEELHRHGDERSWWINLQIDALKVANEIWAESEIHAGALSEPYDHERQIALETKSK